MELAQQLQDIQNNKRDFIVPTSEQKMEVADACSTAYIIGLATYFARTATDNAGFFCDGGCGCVGVAHGNACLDECVEVCTGGYTSTACGRIGCRICWM